MGFFIKMKKNKILRSFVFKVWGVLAIICFKIKIIFFEDKRYKNIKSLKNKYIGKRCFIIATGPSLKVSDLELLKNEITISMNSIINILDKTEYRPNVYMIQDKSVYEKINKNGDMNKLDPATVYIGISNIGHKGFSEKDIVNKKWNLFHLDVASSWYSLKCNKFVPKFSTMCEKKIMDGTTITYSAIQLAMYMGFKRIYLIGTDCNYKGQKKHIVDYGMNLEEKDIDLIHKNMIISFKKAKVEAKKYNVEIYNATRGGMLEVFPRVNLEEIL